MDIEIKYNGSLIKTTIDGKYFPQIDSLKKAQVITCLKILIKDFENQMSKKS